MKPVLFLAAAMALAAGPAVTQEAPAPPSPPSMEGSGTPSNFLSFMNDPYRLENPYAPACFSGKSIIAAHRTNGGVAYVQPKHAPIYRMELAEECAALDGAQKVTVRNGGYRVCQDGKAVLEVTTASGVKRCKARKVHLMTRTEVAEIAAQQQR